MKLKYDGIIMDVDIIGGFKLEKAEYAVCSYLDSEKNCKIVIVQVFKNGNTIKTRAVPEKDIDMVITKYKEIEKYLLGGNENE